MPSLPYIDFLPSFPVITLSWQLYQNDIYMYSLEPKSLLGSGQRSYLIRMMVEAKGCASQQYPTSILYTSIPLIFTPLTGAGTYHLTVCVKLSRHCVVQ
jgi:hypothetical protein